MSSMKLNLGDLIKLTRTCSITSVDGELMDEISDHIHERLVDNLGNILWVGVGGTIEADLEAFHET